MRKWSLVQKIIAGSVLSLLCIVEGGFAQEVIECPSQSPEFQRGDFSRTKQLNLRVQGFDGEFYNLAFQLKCQYKDGEILPWARLVSDNGFVDSFNTSLRSATVLGVDLISNIDTQTGVATPELFLLIGDELHFNIQVSVSFRWGERTPGDVFFNQSYRFFEVRYSVYYYVRHRKKFEQQSWAKRVPMTVDYAQSTALFEEKTIGITPR